MDLATAKRKTPWVTDDDLADFVALAEAHSIDPISLGLAVYFESNFHTDIKSPRSSATGLFQWMDGNAPDGSSSAQLRLMSFQQQLHLASLWLDRYARNAGKPLSTAGQVYTTIVAPARIKPGFSEETVLYRAGSGEYEANHAWDYDKDGVITVSDLTSLLTVKQAATDGWKPWLARITALIGASGGGGPTATRESSPLLGGPVIGVVLGLGAIGAALAYTQNIGGVATWANRTLQNLSPYLPRLPRLAF